MAAAEVASMPGTVRLAEAIYLNRRVAIYPNEGRARAAGGAKTRENVEIPLNSLGRFDLIDLEISHGLGRVVIGPQGHGGGREGRNAGTGLAPTPRPRIGHRTAGRRTRRHVKGRVAVCAPLAVG